MKHADALELANAFVERLRSCCIRLEIVGSVKRADKPDVHDIEILLIPKNEHPLPEFGKPKQLYKTVLDKVLADLEYQEIIRQPYSKKDGEKYKKRAIVGTGELDEFCLDLFIVNEATWGIQNVIRTGPHEFSRQFVTNKAYRGLLPDDLQYIKGETKIVKRSTQVALSLPEEADAIEILGLGWIEPGQRWKYAGGAQCP
jgi:DNA polymerase/3'-5' exonuclease PolX